MDDLLKPEQQKNVFQKLHPIHRILIGFIFASLGYIFLKAEHLHPLLLMLYVWDIFAFVVLSISWIVFYTRTTAQIRQFARKEDGSLAYVFLLIILASFTCIFALVLLFVSKDKLNVSVFLFLLAVLPAMAFSWLMIHTTFTFHYAHMYYDDLKGDNSRHAEGLIFPNEKKPDYLDFAYFSFVIGMTFQVSDTAISSRMIRRQALFHGMISFILNTFIVALTINLLAALKK
ncbi:MAG: DUF1345 domain-containing protein [Chitinophagales bacterium]